MQHTYTMLLVSCLLASCSNTENTAVGRSDDPTDMASEAREPDICDLLGLTRLHMLESTGAEFGDVAGDFTVNTLEGQWTLSEAWTGCESYVFINYADTDYGNTLWSTQPDEILRQSVSNTQYFFIFICNKI